MKKIQIITVILLFIVLFETLNGQYFSFWETSTVSRIGKRVTANQQNENENYDKIILLDDDLRGFGIPLKFRGSDGEVNRFNKRFRYIINGLSQLDKIKKVN
jgi:hypothetical protein